MSTSRDHLRSAAEHLRTAAGTAAEAIVPPDVRNHLRSAAREALLAGVAAIDAADERARAAKAAATPPAASPGA